MDPPPPRTSRRVRLVPTVAAAVIFASCASSRTQSAAPVTVARIPSPFEVGQEIGLGDIRLVVPSFRHSGGTLTVQVTAVNGASTAFTIDPARDFDIFYGSRHWRGTVTSGSAAPIPPASRASFTVRFRVPARYSYPLLWFRSPVGGVEATVVLRGRGRG